MSQKVQWMPRVSWPDYLFKLSVAYPDDVAIVNQIIARHHGRRLLW
jgi:hypothetical protein